LRRRFSKNQINYKEDDIECARARIAVLLICKQLCRWVALAPRSYTQESERDNFRDGAMKQLACLKINCKIDLSSVMVGPATDIYWQTQISSAQQLELLINSNKTH
jgi:hypothetical protein